MTATAAESMGNKVWRKLISWLGWSSPESLDVSLLRASYLDACENDQHLRAEIQALKNALAAAQSETQAISTEKLILQDRLEQALNDRARVWDVMREALAGERTAYQMTINIDHQKQYGIAPYPDSPKLPTDRVPQQQEGGPAGGRMTASQAVQQAGAAFTKEFVRRTKQALEK